MSEVKILEKLEEQLNTLKHTAAQNGYTDIAVMIHKMREQSRAKRFDITATELCEKV